VRSAPGGPHLSGFGRGFRSGARIIDGPSSSTYTRSSFGATSSRSILVGGPEVSRHQKLIVEMHREDAAARL
jgi:hypothetical protein